MNLQIALVILIGMISARNANFYMEYEYDYDYGENDSNDYYENLYDDPVKKTKGTSNIFIFDKIILFNWTMKIYMNILTKVKRNSLSLEKILELIRVNDEIPCLRFLFSSNGLIQTVTPNKLGVYTLASDFLFADRLVYLKGTPSEFLAFLSGWNPDSREYYDWRVRYEI